MNNLILAQRSFEVRPEQSVIHQITIKRHVGCLIVELKAADPSIVLARIRALDATITPWIIAPSHVNVRFNSMTRAMQIIQHFIVEQLISPEFAAVIQRERLTDPLFFEEPTPRRQIGVVPYLVDVNYGPRGRSVNLFRTIRDYAVVPPPEPISYRIAPLSARTLTPGWQSYDPVGWGPDVKRSDEPGQAPEPGIFDQKITQLIEEGKLAETDIPDEMRCKIGFHIMQDPVYFKDSSQFIYDRATITHNLLFSSKEPFTRQAVTEKDLVSDQSLKDNTQFFVEEAQKRAKGLENKFSEAKVKFSVERKVEVKSDVSPAKLRLS